MSADTDTEVGINQMNIREYSQLTDGQRTALKGRPQLGEVTSVTIRLKESKEFKVSTMHHVNFAFQIIQAERKSLTGNHS